MRRQVRSVDTSMEISEKAVEETRDTDKKFWILSDGLCRRLLVRLLNNRRHGRLAFVSLIVITAFYVICSRVYELWIQQYPRWVFRRGDSNTVAAFFHTYIPPNKGKKGVREALDIVREQLKQISARKWDKPISVYFTTTGVEHVAKREAEQTCSNSRNLDCHWMGHWKKGQEELTLSRLYNFCQYSPTSTVLYLHTKGSFHADHGRNHAWRWYLTEAALTCARARTIRTCDVCGLQFYPVWSTFYPGNMWSASCSYINQLWSPREFASRLKDAIRSARASERFVWTLYNASNPGNLGLGRYAMEHWVASHPHLRPCEIITNSPRLEVWHYKNVTQSVTVVEAPHHAWETEGWFRWNVTRVREMISSVDAQREYFLLPGFVHKWRHLYHDVPPMDSWAWKWYPDSDAWQSTQLRL